MSYFLGTPSNARVWALKHSEFVTVLDPAKQMRKRLLSGATVDIFVGAEKRQWTLHRNLLCHHSPYFSTEFEGNEVPKKEHDNTLKLPDDDPRGFELLVKWLYQGCLEDVSHMDEETRYEYAVACHKLYQLCDKFDMIYVKNLAMDAYRQSLHAAQLVPDAEEMNDIYRASPRGSPFRTLMCQIAARQIMDPEVEKDAETYRICFDQNPDFAIDMINAIRLGTGGVLFDDPTEDDDCTQWHDHRDGNECHRIEGNEERSPGRQRKKKGSPRKLRRPEMAELAEKSTPLKKHASRVASSTPEGRSDGDRIIKGDQPTPTNSPQDSKTVHFDTSPIINGGHPWRRTMPTRAKNESHRAASTSALLNDGLPILKNPSMSDSTRRTTNELSNRRRVSEMVGEWNGISKEKHVSFGEKSENGVRKAPPKLRKAAA